MTMIYLVRHAKPAATWGEAIDPGLDEQGKDQARSVASELFHRGPLPIFTSPLRRCRETSEPLCVRWQSNAEALAPVAEIPSPPLSMAAKTKWLQEAMQGSWPELQQSAPPNSPDFLSWRNSLLQALRELQRDCVIFTHYIAINVAVGAAQEHDRVISFRPGHASVTSLEITKGRFAVRELGKEIAGGGVLLGR